MTTKRRKEPAPILVERTLPHNLEAERSILGAILLNGESFDEVVGIIRSTDFFRDAHRRIFESAERLVSERSIVDLVTVKNELARRGELDECGGPAYVSALIDGVPRSTNVAHYAGIVLEYSNLRQTIYTANKLLSRAYESEDARTLVADATEELLGLAGNVAQSEPVLVGDLLPDTMERIERTHEPGRGVVTGLASGFVAVDELTAGMHPCDVTIIAARPGMGKTALALNIAKNVATTDEVLIFSLEMSKEQLMSRLVAAEARVDSHRIRSGASLTTGEWQRIANSLGTIQELRLRIDDTSGLTVAEVRAKARKVQKEHGLALVVIDYVQLMKGRGRFEGRNQEVGSISRGVKAVAKELKVPIILLAQLNRSSEAQNGRKARPPQVSDLRESGDLEADADVIILIHRPEGDKDEDSAELIIGKQRNGPTGVIKAVFDKACVRFSETALGL